MISWLARRAGRRVVWSRDTNPAVDPDVTTTMAFLAREGAEVEFYLLEVGIGIPTLMCIGFGDGRRWPGAVVGLGAHLSPRVAMRRAILEVAQVGPQLRTLASGGDIAIPCTPGEVRTLLDHALFYAPAERAVAFDWLRSTRHAVDVTELAEPTDLSLAECARRVEAAGVRVAVVDVTSPDVALGPFRVVRALAPGLQPLHIGAGFEHLANPRLKALASGGVVLNSDPHPLC